MKGKKSTRRVHRCTCPECQGHSYSETAKQHRAINRVVASLDEHNRRRLVGLLARHWGWGGIGRLNRITGLSRNTLLRGKREITQGMSDAAPRIRRPGGGRLPVEKNSPEW